MGEVGSKPSVVVYPSSTEDVVKIVKTAVKYRMPVVPYSGATSLEGHFRAVSQQVCRVLCVLEDTGLNDSLASRPWAGYASTCPRWIELSRFTVGILGARVGIGG